MLWIIGVPFLLSIIILADVIRGECYRWVEVWPRKPGAYSVAWWAVRYYGWLDIDILRRRDGAGSLITIKFKW